MTSARDGVTASEMIVVNYDKGFAKMSQHIAFGPVAQALSPRYGEASGGLETLVST